MFVRRYSFHFFLVVFFLLYASAASATYPNQGCYILCGPCPGGFSALPDGSCPAICVSTTGQTCYSTPNSCGQTTAGTVNCSGSCSATTPPSNPSNYGNSCSVTNACGQSTFGTIQCDSSCSASANNGTCPDLTADPIAQNSATKSIPQNFTSLIKNIGGGATNSAGPNQFYDLFQRANDAFGNGAIDIGTFLNNIIAAMSSNTATLSYTFPSAGTYYLRACADKSSAGDATGLINEGTNEGNNCSSPWKQIIVEDLCYGGGCTPNGSPTTPGPGGTCGYAVSQPSGNPFQCCSLTSGACPAVPALPTVVLTATPQKILSGSSSKLTWSSNASVISCTGTPTNFAGGAPNNASGVSVGPNGTTNYSIDCPDLWGHHAVSSATVTVVNANLTISAIPKLVRKGDRVTVSWSTTGADITSCSTSGPGVSSTQLNGSVSNVVVNTESTYTLSCVADSFHLTQSVTVKLIPQGGEI